MIPTTTDLRFSHFRIRLPMTLVGLAASVIGLGTSGCLRAEPLSDASLPGSNAPMTAGSPRDREPIQPIPLGQKLDARKVALGEALFHEPRLSQNNTVSCSICHDLAKGGADGRARSIGINQREGTINAPSVFNSSFSFKQFWDGRAATLEEQIHGPLLAAAEMGSSWEEVVEKLRATQSFTLRREIEGGDPAEGVL